MRHLKIICRVEVLIFFIIKIYSTNKLMNLILKVILDRPGVDPNATAVRGALAGTVAGSTPPVLLAATRGYYKVVEVFKSYYR